jgi:hypothetical protein
LDDAPRQSLSKLGMNMRLFSIVAVVLAGSGICRAGDLNINVLLSGQVAPGVYGQVQIGNAPPPPVVYAEPMVIQPPPMPLPPVYLHVPPGHAKNWRKYCYHYNACNRPVYFVRSAEYEPGYQPRYSEHEHEHGHHHGEGDHGHGHDDRDH